MAQFLVETDRVVGAGSVARWQVGTDSSSESQRGATRRTQSFVDGQQAALSLLHAATAARLATRRPVGPLAVLARFVLSRRSRILLTGFVSRYSRHQ